MTVPRAFAIIVLVVLAACGQKTGVHVAPGQVERGGTAATVDRTLGRDAGSSALADASANDGSVAVTSGAGGHIPTMQSGLTTPGAEANNPAEVAGGDTSARSRPRAPNEPDQKDRTGADPDVLRIGAHAPATGAAPIPIDAFEKAMNVYFRWQTEVKGQRIVGRSRVEAIFRDDGYNPSTAIQVCREMIEAQKVFLLIGGGGADQIAACAGLTNQRRVPYLAGGASEIGVTGMPWYFPFSMSYPRQSTLLARMIAERFPGEKVAMVVTDTPYFEDAIDAFETAVAELRIPYHATVRHPKGDTSWYDQTVLELSQADVGVVFALTSGLDYIRLARRAHVQRYEPRFVGVGIGFGLNAIARVACPAGDGALAFSPFPGMDQVARFDPEFDEAVERFELQRDDYAWIIWGASRFLHTVLDRYEQQHGTDLTREDFRDFIERLGEFDSGIYPPMIYSPQDHFGARSVHILRQSCTTDGGEFVTDTTYYAG